MTDILIYGVIEKIPRLKKYFLKEGYCHVYGSHFAEYVEIRKDQSTDHIQIFLNNCYCYRIQ